MTNDPFNLPDNLWEEEQQTSAPDAGAEGAAHAPAPNENGRREEEPKWTFHLPEADDSDWFDQGRNAPPRPSASNEQNTKNANTAEKRTTKSLPTLEDDDLDRFNADADDGTLPPERARKNEDASIPEGPAAGSSDAEDDFAPGDAPPADQPAAANDLHLTTDQLPSGFSVVRDEIVFCDEKGRIIRICRNFALTSMAQSADGLGGTEIVLQFEAISGDLREVRIPRRHLAGDGAGYRAELLDLGFDMSNTGPSRQLLSELLTRLSSPKWTTAYSRVGWTDRTYATFILPGGVGIGPEGLFAAGNIGGSRHGFEESGTLPEWQEHIGAIATRNPLAMFAMSCTFLGPLLEPLSMESGGFHLMGGSSEGKTATVRLALSIFGSPKLLLITWNSTTNGLAARAALRNSTILAIDELKEAPAKVVGETVYMIMNGIGRSRAGRTGDAKETERWTLPCLSTGEMSIAEHLRDGGEQFHAGQEVRMLSIVADGRKHGAFDFVPIGMSGIDFVSALEEDVEKYHGVAGRVFLTHLISQGVSPEDLKARQQTYFELLKGTMRTDPSGTLGRVMRRFAAVMLVGEIATELGVTGWESGASTEAGVSIFRQWRETSELTVLSEGEAAIARVRDFILRGEHSRFSVPGTPPPVRMAGWRGPDGFYVLDSVWATEMHPGLSATRMASHLKKAGLLICQEHNRLQSKVPTDLHPDRPRAYLIASRILGDGHSEEDERREEAMRDEAPF